MRTRLTLYSFLSMLCVLVSSCFDEEETVMSPNVSIDSFSINDLQTEVTLPQTDGTDTTYTLTVEGEHYAFAIDHVAGVIYNRDSLPYGTDVKAVTINLGFTGYYVCHGEDQKVWQSADSIDFTTPVRFTVYAYDGVGAKTYYVNLNVHQMVTDTLIWNEVTPDKELGLQDINNMQVLVKNDSLYMFVTKGDGQKQMTRTATNDGRKWDTPITMQGLEGETICEQSIELWNGNFYLLSASGTLYTSAEGINWTRYPTPDDKFTTMVGVVAGNLCMRGDEKIYEINENGEWSEIEVAENPEKMGKRAGMTNTPLATNNEIIRTTWVGVYEGEDYATIWTKLSSEERWTCYQPIEPERCGLPALSGMKVLGTEGVMLALGGGTTNGRIAPFDTFYKSTDGGISWSKVSDGWSFPEKLKGFEGVFDAVTDAAGGLWVICAGEHGGIYRTRLTWGE